MRRGPSLTRCVVGAGIALLLGLPAQAATRVMVLPFDMPGANPEQAALGIGTTDSLITALTRVPAFTVVDRTTVAPLLKEQAFAQTGLVDPTTAVRMGQILGVQAIISGRLQILGDQVRLTATFIDAATSQVRRSEQVTGKLSELFALQDQLAARFVTDQGVMLSPQEVGRVGQVFRSTADLAAYAQYQRARSEYLRFTPEGYRAAIARFDEAIAIDPSYALAHAGKAEALAHWGAYKRQTDRTYQSTVDAALAAARHAIQLQDDLPEARRALALALHAGDQPGAVQAAQMALGLLPNDAEAHLVAWMVRDGRDPDGPDLRRALDLNPRLLLAHLQRSRALVLKTRLAEGITAYREALRLDPRHVEALVGLGWAHYKAAQRDEAVVHLRQAIALEPDHAEAYNLLASCLDFLGRADESLAALRAGVRHNPLDPLLWMNLGAAHYLRDQSVEAIAAYDKALALEPATASLLNNYAAALADVGRLSDAIAAIRRAVRLEPTNGRWQATLGSLLFRANQTGAAEVALIQAIAMQPDTVGARMTLASIRRQQQRHGEALPLLSEAIAISPKLNTLYFNRAQVFIDLQRYEEAATDLGMAIALNGADLHTHISLARVWQKLGRMGDAASEFQAAIRLAPQDADLKAELGHLMLEQGRLGQAKQAFEAALKLDPQHQRARAGLKQIAP